MNKKELIYKINDVLKQYPFVLRAELFGSQQNGTASPASDVDILVKFDQTIRPRGVAIYDIELELESKLNMSVDFVQEHLLYDFVHIGLEREVIYEKTY